MNIKLLNAPPLASLLAAVALAVALAGAVTGCALPAGAQPDEPTPALLTVAPPTPSVPASPTPTTRPALASTPTPSATAGPRAPAIGPASEVRLLRAPRPVIYAEPGLPAELLAALQPYASVETRDFAADVTARSDPAAIAFLGTGAPPAGFTAVEIGRLTWVPVTAHGRFETSVTKDALRALIAGRATDWKQLGGDSGPVSLVVDAETSRGIARALGAGPSVAPTTSPVAPAGRTATPAAPRPIASAGPARTIELVKANRAALGLVPLRALSPEVRALAVDGCSVLSAREPCTGLSVPVWLGIRADASDVEEASLTRDLRAAMAPLDPPAVRLVAAGDIIIGRKVDERIVALRDYLSPFCQVAPELRSADIAVADVEMPMSDRITPSHDWKTYTFGTSTRAVEGLRYAGFDAVSLANNHTMNLGRDAFVDTITTLDRAGIRYFGGGRNDAEAHRPAIVEARGVRYAFLGYDDLSGDAFAAGRTTPGDSKLEPARVAADIRAARQSADVVVTYFHWGVEYTLEPTARQRTIARAAVDSGASLVLGSHPHWAQSVEIYRGAVIAYSLGNFVFDQNWSTETQQGLVVRTLWIAGRLASFDLLPVRIYDLHQPRFLPLEQGEGRAILQRVWRASERYLAR